MPASRSRITVSLILGLAAASGLTGVARAALGEGPLGVETDAVALHGAVHVESRQDYEVYEILAPAGTRVLEYANQSGIVFALSWSGPAPPDLQRWLGAYFADYASALATLSHRGLRRSLRIETAGGLIVEASGHLRAYSGKACLKDRMPPGFASGALR